MKTLRHLERGLSLIEMMIALTLGLLLLAGLVSVFSSSSQSQRELQKTAEQIENGRYAIDVLTQNLHHAGFFGQFMPTAGSLAALPNPCATGDAAALQSAMGLPLQAYRALTLSGYPDFGGFCATWLNSTNLQAGSDVLVIRRAETTTLAVGSASVSGEVYLQANPVKAAIQFGNGATMTTTSAADGSAATILKKDNTAAEIRKYRVQIYFVSKCSIPAGGGSVCTGSADDLGNPVPTLKRLELEATGGTLGFTVTPVAEGIEYFKIEYGIDNNPSTVSDSTGYIGDAVPDVPMTAPTVADQSNIATAKVFLLARNSTVSAGHDDAKTYIVGGYTLGPSASEQTAVLTAGPFNDQYKRHAYSAEVRITNLSSRRERAAGT